VVKQILIYAVAFGVAVVLMRQVRKPNRWIGRPFLWLMNRTHSALTDWGLEHVAIEKDFTILDVGCGGGRTIQKLAAIAREGSVYGVDYASGSVAASRAKNAELIKAGRVEVRQGSVSHLPFSEAKFDLVTAVETQYYWPDMVNDMKEIRRTLKPGGRLIIIAETFSGGRFDNVKGSVMLLLGSNALSEEKQRELFRSAGYDEIETFVEKRKGWICVVGRKPS
jgi:SAM-dependent methyltransferase